MDFPEWSTPLIADACMRLGLQPRVAPHGLRPLQAGMRAAGRVRPVRHYGSVDVFLESLTGARTGEAMVIDNGGRTDEGCIGDLTVLEMRAHGLSGAIVWGAHRDTPELLAIGFPVFSHGTCPAGPRRLDEREPEAFESARVGPLVVTGADHVFADDDGAVFVPGSDLERIAGMARRLRTTEREQARGVSEGRTLKEQFRFDEFLGRRAADPSLTFRRHLRGVQGAIEE